MLISILNQLFKLETPGTTFADVILSKNILREDKMNFIKFLVFSTIMFTNFSIHNSHASSGEEQSQVKEKVEIIKEKLTKKVNTVKVKANQFLTDMTVLNLKFCADKLEELGEKIINRQSVFTPAVEQYLTDFDSKAVYELISRPTYRLDKNDKSKIKSKLIQCRKLKKAMKLLIKVTNGDVIEESRDSSNQEQLDNGESSEAVSSSSIEK